MRIAAVAAIDPLSWFVDIVFASPLTDGWILFTNLQNFDQLLVSSLLTSRPKASGDMFPFAVVV